MHVPTLLVVANETNIGTVRQSEPASENRYVERVAPWIIYILGHVVIYDVVAYTDEPRSISQRNALPYLQNLSGLFPLRRSMFTVHRVGFREA
jgi:hypothetical protein